MKEYEFLCGGDHGAWECLVTVKLTEEESSRLIAWAQNHEFLDYDRPVKDIYLKALAALDEQCDDEDLDANTIVIRVPTGLRTDGL